MNKILQNILRKQFEIADYSDLFDSIDFKKDGWYNLEWTDYKERQFRKWFIDHLYKSRKSRNVIMNFPTRNKKRIQEVYGWWNLTYGFKIKN